jgi:hypothetical protein
MNGLDALAATAKHGAGIVAYGLEQASPEIRPSSTWRVERWCGHR